MKECEQKQASPEFWNDQDEAGRVVKKVKSLRQWTEPLNEASALADDLRILAEMALEEKDEDSAAEVRTQLLGLEKAVEHLDFQFLLSDVDDERAAVSFQHFPDVKR